MMSLRIFIFTFICCYSAFVSAEEINCSGTQIEINMCAKNSFENINNDLEELIIQAKKTFNKEGEVDFDKVQNAWKDYREKEAIFSSSYQADGGSVKPMIYNNAKELITKERIKSLTCLLEGYYVNKVESAEKKDWVKLMNLKYNQYVEWPTGTNEQTKKTLKNTCGL